MKPPHDLTVLLLLLLQLPSPLPPLIHAATATATIAGQADTAPPEVGHQQSQQQQPQLRFEVSTSSTIASHSQCGKPHEISPCRTGENPHYSAEQGGGDAAAKGSDREKCAAADKRVPTTASATNGQRKSEAASSSHHLPWVDSRKPLTVERTATEDDYDYDYDYSYYEDEYNDNAEQLRKKVALEQMSKGGKQPTLEHMKHSRGCHQLPKGGRPLYTEVDWQRLRQIYKDQGGATIKSQDETPAGFVPPMRSGQTSDGKGRGVFAARDIKRGERTYGGIKNYAFFTDAPSYRRFLDALANHEACDVMMWTWTEDTLWQRVILLSLDDNALQNSGAGDEANTGTHPDDHGPWGIFDEFALRDIQEGEELLCDYNHFFGNFWDDFGL